MKPTSTKRQFAFTASLAAAMIALASACSASPESAEDGDEGVESEETNEALGDRVVRCTPSLFQAGKACAGAASCVMDKLRRGQNPAPCVNNPTCVNAARTWQQCVNPPKKK